MDLKRSGFGVVFGIGLLTGSAAPAADLSRFKIDLLERPLVVVRGAIGPLENLRFLIDTGAMPSMVDRRVAKKLGLDVAEGQFVAFGQKTRVTTARLPEIRLGALRVPGVTAGIGDLSFLGGVDVVVGLDVLSRSSFSIDYDERELVLGPVSQRDPGVLLDITPPFLTVQVNIAGRPFRFLVDTGSGRLVLFGRRVLDRLPALSPHGELSINHLSGTSTLKRVLLPSVEAGGSAMERVEAFISDAKVDDYPPGIDGVLGIRVLASKRAGFDFERNRLTFAR